MRQEKRPGRRPVLKRLLLLLFTLVTMLGIAELGLRVVLDGLHKGRVMGFHEELGWLPLPEIKKRGPQWGEDEPGWTNARGYRDEDHSLRKPPSLTRIVALGDSFTFGYGVDYGSRFSEHLEEDVPNLEVVNLGVFAYGTDQQLRVWELEGRRYEPDIVLLMAFLGNDLYDIGCKIIHSYPKPHYLLHGEELELVKPVKTWDITLRESSYLIERCFKVLGGERSKIVLAEPWIDQDTVPLFHSLVLALHRQVVGDGARLLVVLNYPQRIKPSKLPTYEEIRRGLDASGVPTISTREALEAGQADVLYRRGDRHWTAAGHRVVSDVILEDLRDRGWLSR